MNCNDLENRLWAYFEGRLPKTEKHAVDDHAAACSRCGPLLETAGELTCRDFAEFLSDYVENRLPADRKAVFDRHLSLCPDCVNYIAGYRKTIALARDGATRSLGDMPPDLVRAVLEAWSKNGS